MITGEILRRGQSDAVAADLFKNPTDSVVQEWEHGVLGQLIRLEERMAQTLLFLQLSLMPTLLSSALPFLGWVFLDLD